MTTLRGYAAVTAAYWAFMLTDGALRMLVLLHFHRLGFPPLTLAWLFVLYEVAGIATNLVAGWLATRFGLATTLIAGLALQIVALAALTQLDPSWTLAVSVVFVMVVQGASGVAKDLTKTASKSAIKLLIPSGQGARLYAWVAALTGSKNAVKGLGFFLGAALLGGIGFVPALWSMAAGLAAILVAIVAFLPDGLTVRSRNATFAQVFSTDGRVNRLSLARMFLFAARDVWFVVALPIWLAGYLAAGMETDRAFFLTGGFMALWIVFYGFVQALAPRLGPGTPARGTLWVAALAAVTATLAAIAFAAPNAGPLILGGLLLFGAVFAVNSALHSFLILDFAGAGRVTMDVGFYYMANAAGRLMGTALSGLTYQVGGLPLALATSAALAVASGLAVRSIRLQP
ncbi:organoarsenical effux MFS transporter ArsJ [Jannaschia donghaensis]|uniref:Major Facilitator Superfamily protein n=1 Tax=Jannaschia donghaensis TaxID=420998 RepID=A0A0M6YNJ9_9RHOB|nr:organoarsenical effux MFS transporter ArsJ [Jannaschia donghaensis]CTQ50817.1 Major Facilitator Superfamily protein [Jannaschia donghaensis]